MSIALSAVLFVICAGVIARAGFVLTRTADRLAQTYGWGRSWVGMALLATVTSLPELAAGLSAVLWVNAPNLAVGNALGACVFNLGFLVVVDGLQRRQPMYAQASDTHLLSAAFGVVMAGFVGMSLIAGEGVPALRHVGAYTPLLLALYLLVIKAVGDRDLLTAPSRDQGSDCIAQRLRIWRRFGLAALGVTASGIALPEVADTLASALGLRRAVVGTLMMAAVTTLPEMAVTIAALRLRALDLAIGNLLGSNLFNLAILALEDLVYVRGPLLSVVEPVHLGTVVVVMAMSGMVIVGLVMRPRGRVLRMTSWVGVGLLSAYLSHAVWVLLQGS